MKKVAQFAFVFFAIFAFGTACQRGKIQNVPSLAPSTNTAPMMVPSQTETIEEPEQPEVTTPSATEDDPNIVEDVDDAETGDDNTPMEDSPMTDDDNAENEDSEDSE